MHIYLKMCFCVIQQKGSTIVWNDSKTFRLRLDDRP